MKSFLSEWRRDLQFIRNRLLTFEIYAPPDRLPASLLGRPVAGSLYFEIDPSPAIRFERILSRDGCTPRAWSRLPAVTYALLNSIVVPSTKSTYTVRTSQRSLPRNQQAASLAIGVGRDFDTPCRSTPH